MAIAEFLRVFVAYNTNDRLWVVTHDRIDDGNSYSTDWRGETRVVCQYEVQYRCFFCRESLVTLPQRQKLTTKLDSRLNRHAEQCGMMFLAGLTSGSHTLLKRPEAHKADRLRKAREKREALKWSILQVKIEQDRLAAETLCRACRKHNQFHRDARGLCEPCFTRSERYRRLGLTDA